MKRFATSVVMAALCCSTASAVTFGERATSKGINPGHVMPAWVYANGRCSFATCEEYQIDSLDGIGDYDWITTPTTELDLGNNCLASVGTGILLGVR
jgi:hypothetical protein